MLCCLMSEYMSDGQQCARESDALLNDNIKYIDQETMQFDGFNIEFHQINLNILEKY